MFNCANKNRKTLVHYEETKIIEIIKPRYQNGRTKLPQCLER